MCVIMSSVEHETGGAECCHEADEMAGDAGALYTDSAYGSSTLVDTDTEDNSRSQSTHAEGERDTEDIKTPFTGTLSYDENITHKVSARYTYPVSYWGNTRVEINTTPIVCCSFNSI